MTLLTETPTVTFAASDFAARPAEARGLARDEVRLLVGTPDGLDHVRFRDLPDHLRAGDVLVVNDSATVPGEVDATLDGAAVVLHVAARLDEGERVVEVRSAPDAARAVLDAGPGDVVQVGDAHLTLLAPWPTGAASSPTGRGNRLWRARVAGPLDDLLARRGRPIAYGYLDGRYPLAAYQTVFGRRPGSAEMASAGRPFTEALVTRLVSAGVLFAPVTLHTGVSSQEAGEAPGPEWFEVSPTDGTPRRGGTRRRWARHRGGDHRHPRDRVRRGGRCRHRVAGLDVARGHARATRRGWSTAWSPAGTIPTRPTCCWWRRSPGGRSPRRRTTRRWPGATSGTSSATPRCCWGADSTLGPLTRQGGPR